MSPSSVRSLATALVVCAVIAAVVGAIVPSPSHRLLAAGTFEPLVSPQRVLDTRPGEVTADGGFAGIGVRAAGSTLELMVAGRVGVPVDATAVVLNVTVTQPGAPGFATVFPCGVDRPTASNVNYTAAGQTVANSVVAKVGVDGRVCLYTLSAAHYVVDVTGYFPVGTFEPLVSPQRVLDTRPGEVTADGGFAGIGVRAAGSTLELMVAGRVGVPVDATAVVLNVTVTQPGAPGFATVFPCGVDRPTASNVNYTAAGQTVANSVVAKVGVDGRVCLYTLSAAHYVVDVSGYFPVGTFEPLVSPQRVLDTRPGEVTADGGFAGIGVRAAGSTLRLAIDGRVSIPNDATAVVLNVTVTDPAKVGYTTVYPNGVDRPTASNLNYGAGQTVPNTVIARVGAGGDICLFTLSRAHYLVDVSGYFVGTPPPTDGADCSAAPPPPGPQLETGFAYPASVSGRKWIDQDGEVYLLKAMASWAMAQNLSDAEITTALDSVAARGFNAVQVFMFGYDPRPDWTPYRNAAGEPVFTGAPFRSPLGAGWSSMDRVVTEAHRLGLTVVMSLYTAFGDTGPRAAIESAYSADAGNMYDFGHAVATRYAAYPNIVWSIGADDSWTWGTTVASAVDTFMEGIRAAEGTPHRLVVAQPANGATAYSQWPSALTGSGGFSHLRLDANAHYEYQDDTVQLFDATYQEDGAAAYPVWDSEPPYVSAGHPGGENRQELRERIYSTFIRGGVGINYGAEDWWPFGKSGLFSGPYTWGTVMAGPEAADAQRAWSVLDAHVADATWAPSPDGGFLNSGVGAGDTKAAVGTSASAALVYFPSDRGTVEVDTTVLAGDANVRLRWYDPTNGSYQTIAASEAQSAARVIAYPGANASGDGDWVLVVSG